MINPYNEFKVWLSSLETANLQDIAFLMSTNPYLSEVRYKAVEPDEMIEKFWEIVDKYSEPSLESADFLVTFKATFDYYFESRSSEEGWDVVEKRHNQMIKDPKLTPSMQKHLTKMILDLPERKKSWIELCQRWEDLKRNALSNNNIKAWEQTKFFENLNQKLPSIN